MTKEEETVFRFNNLVWLFSANYPEGFSKEQKLTGALTQSAFYKNPWLSKKVSVKQNYDTGPLKRFWNKDLQKKNYACFYYGTDGN